MRAVGAADKVGIPCCWDRQLVPWTWDPRHHLMKGQLIEDSDVHNLVRMGHRLERSTVYWLVHQMFPKAVPERAADQLVHQTSDFSHRKLR